jgi:predicted HD superfamily hydrolase involved in NAD metabolism
VSSPPTYDEALSALAARLSTKARRHCESVSRTAAELAARFGVDTEDASLAGLLHDWGRDDGDAALLEAATRYGLPIHDVDRAVPYLLHAEVSAMQLREAFPALPDRIVAAVACHTFGRVGMTPLDKVVYIADTIEPQRDFLGVEDLRGMARGCDLDELFVATYARSVSGVIERRRPIHPDTAAVWNWIVTEARA